MTTIAIDLTTSLQSLSSLGRGRQYCWSGCSADFRAQIEVADSTSATTTVVVATPAGPSGVIPLPGDASVAGRFTLLTGSKTELWVTGDDAGSLVLDLTTSFQDVSGFTEGREVFLGGAPKGLVVAIEVASSTGASTYVEVARLNPQTQSYQLPSDSSVAMRYRVVAGAVGPNTKVWICSAESGGAGQSEALAYLTIAALEAVPGPVEVSSASVKQVGAVYVWKPGDSSIVDHITILGATGGTAGRWFLQGDQVTFGGTEDVALQAMMILLSGTGISLAIKEDVTFESPVNAVNDLAIYVDESIQLIGNITGSTSDRALFYYGTTGITHVTAVAATVATTLNGGISATVEVLTLTSGSGFPTLNFWIQIDSELIYVLSRSGTSCYVERGAEGSVPATHSNAATVSQVPGLFTDTITVGSTTGIATNTWVYVVSVLGTRGMYCQVTNVSGSVLTLSRPILWSFLIGDTVDVYSTTSPVLQNFSITGRGKGGILTGKCVIYIDLVGTENCSVDGMRCQSNGQVASDAGIAFQNGFRNSCTNCAVDGTGVNASNKLLAFIGQEQFTGTNLDCQNGASYAFGINDCVNSTFTNLTGRLNTYGVVCGTETAAVSGIHGCRWLFFNNTRMTENTTDGFVLDLGSSDVVVNGFLLNGNGGYGANITNFVAGNCRQLRNTFMNGEGSENTSGGINIGDGTYASNETQLINCRWSRNTGHGITINALSLGTYISGRGPENNENAAQTASDMRALAGFRAVGLRMNTGCSSTNGVISFEATDLYELVDCEIIHRSGSRGAVGILIALAGVPKIYVSNTVLTAGHANDILIWNAAAGAVQLANVRATLSGAPAGTIGVFTQAGSVVVGPGSDFSACATPLSQSAGTITIANGLYFSINLTLVGGTKTSASGVDLTFARLVSVLLTTPTTAVGTPVASFVAGANGNVTVTSYTAGAIQAATDASTYTVIFTGAQ